MNNKFDVVLLDPPWPYYAHNDKRQPFAEDHYSLMTEQDIYHMPVKEYTHKNSVVFIWATTPKLHMAINAISEWGFKYRGVAHVWCKTTKDGRPLNGSGVRATYSKPTVELLLFASIKESGRPLPLSVENLPNQVMAPRGKHSEKPEIFQDFIEAAYPDATKLELFARRYRQGWTCTGLELNNTNYLTGALL